MTLTYKGLNKRGNQAIYTGLRTAVRFPLAAFENKTAPQSIEIEGAFAEAKAPRAPRVKLTAEQRKALPKPTLAEKVRKAEERAAKLREKLAKDNEQEPALTM